MTALGDALKHFRRAEAVYEAYQDSNQRMVHAFDTKVNICSRLAALRDEVAFAPFKGSDMALRRQVYAQQLTFLNDLGDTLASLTDEQQQLAKQLAQRCRDLAGVVRSAKTSQAALRHKLGPQPSVAEVLSTMAAMSASVGTHLEVAHTCVSAVGLKTTMQELVALQQYLRDAPELKRDTIRPLMQRILDAQPLEPQ